ncbi:hypothetical protein CM318V1_210099 [Carnobacterium maltaromaticum]|uniref:hypothetical protein n=1 Tax=Carnobacterium maltaromaticum TaxID=2751 RepID=UPI0007048BDB|nr:hypothetical protein [Carnobacterium maltaromaticum]KRN72381.1 hypothetical protein IV76_GL002607 [Carnobacterium maltaromaticum]CRH18080.1 hypothetical protein CM318V1_210099 [Carnobacterium maltaromaticum]
MFILAQIVNLELIQKSEPGWLTPAIIASIITSIIAAGAVLYNSWKTNETLRENNKESIQANVNTKARIERIEKVTGLIAEFISNLDQWRELYIKFSELTDEDKNQNKGKELIELLDKKRYRLDHFKCLIKLYFPKEEDESFLENFKTNVELVSSLKENPENIDNFKDSLDKTIKESQLYLRKEWDETTINKKLGL